MYNRAALLPLLLFASALHAQIALGPERFVCQPRFAGPAAGAAAATTNGAETLVVVQPYGAESSLYAQRLGAGAEPLTPHGVPIARGVSGSLGGVASDRAGYVVFWSGVHAVWSLSISASGEVSAPQIVATTDNVVFWPRIVSNGSGYLAAWSDTTGNSQQAMAVRLDSQGKPIGDPFPLSERRNNEEIWAIATDGRDYLVAVEHYTTAAKTTLVSVSAAGAVVAKADLPLFLRELLHTSNGFIGLWDETGTKAVAVDPSGHLGIPTTISADIFESASSNGSDVMSIGFTSFRPFGATRIRRNGDAIETIEHTTLTTSPFTQIVAGAMHTGEYFAMSLSNPIGVEIVNAPPIPERPLLTFATPQRGPAIAADGDQHVVAWLEGAFVRAARLRGGVTLDSDGLDVGVLSAAELISPSFNYPATLTLASNAGRTLIAWTVAMRVGEAGILAPVRLDACILAADGTLSAPFTIASGNDNSESIFLVAATATSNGFLLVWQVNGRLRAARIDANGNVADTVPMELGGGFAPALARRGDGFLLVYSDTNGDLAAVPFHADGTPAGPKQPVAATVDQQLFADVAGDGNGHFLAVWTRSHDNLHNEIWSQALDENGVPAGVARLLGSGDRAHVTWSGSTFVAVSGANVALLAENGRLLTPLVPTLPANAIQTVIAGDTIATLHSGIDAGVGDEYVVFVRRFTAGRHRAARP